MRILVTRTDRLGDVMLATPVLERIRSVYPQAEISFLVEKAWMPVLQYGSDVELIEYLPDESVESLAGRLREKSFDIAVVIRDEGLVTKAVKKARIPKRVGPYSSLRSFVSFNRGKIQRRSHCRMHEAEYNLDLLTRIGIPFPGAAKDAESLPRSWVATSESSAIAVENWLREMGLSFKGYYCMHPGSSGSARYISTETMVTLVNCLLRKGHAVVLTGGPHEAALLNEILHKSGNKTGIGVARALIFEKPLDQLAELYRRSQIVIAHGTGPLHLAAAAGAPAFAIFSPLHVLNEKRWGPLTSRRYTWVPPVDCPEKFKCRGIRCRFYDCMSLFDVEEALQKIEVLAG